MSGINESSSGIGGVAGINGESIDSSTSACLNGGTISGDIEAGGIAGELWGGEALRCQNLGTVKPYAKRHNFGYGGIAGCADHSKMEDCRNDGTIKGWREKDGAVEYNDPARPSAALTARAAAALSSAAAVSMRSAPAEVRA